ncbi:transglutaminase family protein [Arachidicoccus sp.]|uniref:transglutaminase family protein n=1 Tax=Arachidicoccus sp. TaxID=1872624 RepID=UPI003D208F29
MQINSEISALFSLIDDPDEDVYNLVADKIVTYGKEILPNLEDQWEAAIGCTIQERIEEIIHQVNFKSLVLEFQQWSQKGDYDLLLGSTLVAKFVYPYLQESTVLSATEKLRKIIWLELNDCLTSLEKVNVISNMLFNFQEIKSERNNYENTERFFLHNILEKKKGNAISTGMLYQYLCEKLHIPIKLINIPDQFILACYQKNYKTTVSKTNHRDLILFYIDATTGNIFSHADLDNYFELYNISPVSSFFDPLSHQHIIHKLLIEISRCFLNQKQLRRKEELEMLASMITSPKIQLG